MKQPEHFETFYLKKRTIFKNKKHRLITVRQHKFIIKKKSIKFFFSFLKHRLKQDLKTKQKKKIFYLKALQKKLYLKKRRERERIYLHIFLYKKLFVFKRIIKKLTFIIFVIYTLD